MPLGNSFVPVNLGLVEEGDLLKDLESAFQEIQHKMAAYVEEHGDQAKGAKATLKLELAVKVKSTKDQHFAILGKINKSLPARPVRETSAFANHDPEREQFALFVRDSGSTSGDPTQMHLPTPDPAKKAEETNA